MTKYTHLIKLSVGSDTVEDLAAWQRLPQAQSPDGYPWHITRMWPKREDDVLNGGSIYWVIKGVIQCRNKITRLDEVMGGDGIRRCAIVCDPELVRVEPTLKRAFQGWRYFKPEDAPADLGRVRDGEDALPASLSAALAEIGVR
ncbi:DUF1489 domain-containing protein [Marivivens sp. LCG002]|uniref:DUF1489 family protein n=1 Tax=Marivivens sp. LCG002 TaxID=3051171 RepID=UPI002552F3A9|nr:DUF1489 domain-containing protein [Marivivens sp. LCG002]WIV50150.1 DUF1489 domain-containing protein [Marivivens sp. LCG002]